MNNPVLAFDPDDLAMQIESFFAEATDNACTCGSDPEGWCHYCAAWAAAHKKTAELLRSDNTCPVSTEGAIPARDYSTTFAEALRILEQHWYTDEELAQWLVSPQPQLDGLSALQMLAAGRKAEVLACVQRLDDGVYL